MMDTAPRAGTAAAAAADAERYQIRDRLEVVGLLRSLVERRSLVTVVYGNGGVFFVSALLDVRPEPNVVIVDGAVDDAAHAAALASSRLTFVTQLDGIRIQFQAARAAEMAFEGQRALRVRIPDAVMRLQRREHYRMRVPPGEPLTCELRLTPGKPALQPLCVHDISCGGLALVDWPDAAAPKSHEIYRACRLLLPDDVPLVTDLEVVYVLDRTEADGKRVRRAGARFVDLPGKHVTRVQRYITHLERRQKAQREALEGDDR
jgi:c-di-GMP-binding flagellar brake protein YcgR